MSDTAWREYFSHILILTHMYSIFAVSSTAICKKETYLHLKRSLISFDLWIYIIFGIDSKLQLLMLQWIPFYIYINFDTSSSKPIYPLLSISRAKTFIKF